MIRPQRVWLFLLIFTAEGCAHGTDNSLPYDAWRLGFLAPNYMEVWIETADAVDIHNRVYKRAMSGTASITNPPGHKVNPAGWPQQPGGGKGKNVTGADLPRLIYVRWQSLAEPQTYEVYIPITEKTRQLMTEPELAYCSAGGKQITDYRNSVTIGLAPGGIAKAWILGPCLPAIEVARVEGTIHSEGPYDGTSGGKHRPLTDIPRAYIDQHGIPFGSW